MIKQVEKLKNKPVDKFSFQQPLTETEFLPLHTFKRNSVSVQK